MSTPLVRPGLVGTLTIPALLLASLTLAQTPPAASIDRSPVVVASAKVTVSGTSNVIDWSATTNAARTANVRVTSDLPGGDFFWVGVIQPGAVESFDVIVPVADLKSDRDEFTADMHKALKADQYPDIVFQLSRIEKKPGGAKAIGTLRVAGVEQAVELPVVTTMRNGRLLVFGSVDLLMTDFGITPPTAMMGMLKTAPRVTITFETVLARVTT